MGHAEHEQYCFFLQHAKERAVIPEGKRMCPLLPTPTEEFPRELHHEGDGVHPRCHPRDEVLDVVPDPPLPGDSLYLQQSFMSQHTMCLANGTDSAPSCCIYAACTNCMKSPNIVPPKYLNSESMKLPRLSPDVPLGT